MGVIWKYYFLSNGMVEARLLLILLKTLHDEVFQSSRKIQTCFRRDPKTISQIEPDIINAAAMVGGICQQYKKNWFYN